MRKVFRNAAETAHVWASQSQNEGRCSNMFFEGKSIFSYGRHFEIARMVNGVVLFTTRDYSVTTAKHKRLVRDAVTHKVVYTVPDMENHEGNVRAYIQLLENNLARLKKSRSSIQGQLDGLPSIVGEMTGYTTEFKKELTPEIQKEVRKWGHIADSGFIGKETLDKLRKTAAKIAAGVKARREKENTKRAALFASWEKERKLLNETINLWGAEIDAMTLDAWERGEKLPNDPYVNEQTETRIRINGEEIETSRGAYVPLQDAKNLWEYMARNESIKGYKIGSYEVTGIHDGKLVVGCHRIPLRELARMAVKLGLKEEL